MESPTHLEIHDSLKLKGDLSSSLPITLNTLYSGKIKSKKHFHATPQADLQGTIRAQSVQLDLGSRINAEVHIGTRLPLGLKLPSSWTRWFKKQ